MILGPSGHQLYYPPYHREWFEVLPAPYNEDVEVVCVMKPESWELRAVESKDEKYKFGVLVSPKKTIMGLQVLGCNVKQTCDTWPEHQAVMREYGIEAANPAYIGPMARFPQALSLELDRSPLLFVRDSLWRSHLDLRKMWTPSEVKV